jgi:hypothetical protein
MGSRKIPLTLDEHRDIGKTLRTMTHTLQRMGVWISANYTQQTAS